MVLTLPSYSSFQAPPLPPSSPLQKGSVIQLIQTKDHWSVFILFSLLAIAGIIGNSIWKVFLSKVAGRVLVLWTPTPSSTLWWSLLVLLPLLNCGHPKILFSVPYLFHSFIHSFTLRSFIEHMHEARHVAKHKGKSGFLCAHTDFYMLSILMVPVSTSAWEVSKSTFSAVTSHLDTHSLIQVIHIYIFCIYSNIICSKINSFPQWKSAFLPQITYLSQWSHHSSLLCWKFDHDILHLSLSQFCIQSVTIFLLFFLKDVFKSHSYSIFIATHLIQAFITPYILLP